ncbi:MAG: glutathione peroxidase [Elusimicrobiota bacterium]|nr:glutathione peroxidase [Elusimicrobiota bacterium]
MSENAGRARMAIVSALFSLGAAFTKKVEVNPMQSEKTAGRVYEFEMKTIDGKPKKLADYKGHPLLIVNTASLCGFTPQYKDLEDLHKRYGSRGLKIAAFPANEFGKQEPGSDAEIKSFCMTKYSVTFDLFSKIVVKGAGIHPLYQYLTKESGHNGDVSWNFEKFLVGPDGVVKARFGPDASPTGPKIVKAVEELLPK